MVGANQNLNGLRDLTTPLSYQGWFVMCWLALATIHLSTNFEISNATHYEDTKGDAKY